MSELGGGNGGSLDAYGLLEDYSTDYSLKNDFSRQELDVLANYYMTNYSPWLPVELDAPIVDVGCGGGQFLLALEGAGYRNLAGVELSKTQGELARANGVRSKVVVVQDSLAYLAASSPYACIAMNDVLEHVRKEQVIETVSAIHDALQPGGVFLLKVPNMASPFAGNGRYIDFTHEVGFTQESLRQVLRGGGFDECSVWVPLKAQPTGVWGRARRAASEARRILSSAALRRVYSWAGWPVPQMASDLLMAAAIRTTGRSERALIDSKTQ